VIGKLARRAIEALTLLFALLGFCFVPLGNKTGVEHARAVVKTEAAAEAGRELWGAARRLRERIASELARRATEAPSPSMLRADALDGGAPDASLGWP
jgi:hypothetical protein